MWTAIAGAVEWVAGSKAGRIIGAILGAAMGLILLRSKWRSDGAAEQRSEQAAETIKVQERINEAAASYRGDGARKRLRDHSF